jgi:preprotein translocase subunit SecA
MSILTKIFGDPNQKIIHSLQPLVDAINRYEEEMKSKSDDELKDKTVEFKTKIAVAGQAEGEALSGILPEAFAAVREAARRMLGQRHYDVQLIGGIVLHRGQIAEMRTGEGKTLVATLPLYLNALTGRGAHLITVNDYLARVGAGWMAPVYHLLGLTTGVIMHDAALKYDPEFTDDSQYDERLKHFRPVMRRDAYGCDILYGTNNEFGFDYLRDNMVPGLKHMVQRELHYAIVDEVDSILIDEARTPLIISAPAEESTDKYQKFASLVRRLEENEDYNIDEKMRAATLTEAGIAKMEKWLGVDNIYTAGGIREVHHIEQALKAMALFKRDRDYVVKDGEIIIVDEFTGRLMHGRRYSEGLHQAIEAKEGVAVQRESQTLATITFQNYFRLYRKLAGMTGTAMTEAEEFAKIYKLETVTIPTNKPMVRRDLNDLIYRTEAGKFQAVVAEAKRRHELGQPLLIGTISIEKNEILADLMEKSGLKPALLNAKNHEKEAKIIAQAGQTGAITLATNMAGRGVDIMLGGKEPAYAPASSQPSSLKRRVEAEESEEHKLWRQEHDRIVALGGLHVIGTERHEARRIDNQLRGRAGRQGDPGSSQFYVSTEDDLMRIFGGDRMKGLMTTLRVPEDMPIENSMISKSIESAQRKVEGNNFDIRKHLVEYDDVINKHREAIYRKRREVLLIAESVAGKQPAEELQPQISNISAEGGSASGGQNQKSPPAPRLRRAGKIQNSLSDIIMRYVENEIEQVVSFHTAAEQVKEWNLAEIYQVVATIFPVEKKLEDDLAACANDNHKYDRIKARTLIIEHLTGLAKEKYEDMKVKSAQAGLTWPEIEKAILIRSIDTLWIEHLEAIASVRQGIGLRGYGQRDPLIEYKKEAFRLFMELNSLIQKEVVYSIYKVGQLYEQPLKNFTVPNLAEQAREFSAPAKTADARTSSFSAFKPPSKESVSGTRPASAGNRQTADAVPKKIKDSEGHKIGRNDLCPCGSGKKYKKCCGK